MIKISSNVSIEIHENLSNTCTYVVQEYDNELRDYINSWIVYIENQSFSIEIKFSNKTEAQSYCKNLILQGVQA